MMLNGKNVNDTIKACFWTREQANEMGVETIEKKSIIINGVTTLVGFNPEGVQLQKQNISDMLDCLPPKFSDKVGASFLDGDVDKDGKSWTTPGYKYRDMEALFVMGIAIGRIKEINKVPSNRDAEVSIPIYRLFPAIQEKGSV